MAGSILVLYEVFASIHPLDMTNISCLESILNQAAQPDIYGSDLWS